MDFGALPPEVNSGRMYSGPGAGSILTASVEWSAVAAELYSAATDYGSVISGVGLLWRGPASAAMAQAAAPFIAWLSATAGQAEQAAAHAESAAAAHEAAFAATVPPPVIVANRVLLASLVSTNLLGQNSPAIAATEAEYEQMWAQDAAAMYAYAAASAAASTMNPFAAPPLTTNAAGAAGTPAADALYAGSQLMAAVPHALQGLASSPASAAFDAAFSSVSTAVSKLNVLDTPLKMAMYPLNFLNSGLSLFKPAGAAAQAAATDLARAAGSAGQALRFAVPAAGGGGAAMSAGIGRGISIGALSVPQGWAAAPLSGSPAAGLAGVWAAATPPGSAGVAPAGLPVMPLAGPGGRGLGDQAASRFELRPTVVPRSPAGG